MYKTTDSVVFHCVKVCPSSFNFEFKVFNFIKGIHFFSVLDVSQNAFSSVFHMEYEELAGSVDFPNR